LSNNEKRSRLVLVDDHEVTDLREETARLRAEVDAIRRQLAEAHKMASLGRLVAGIVHEINTPVASILSNNAVILRSLDNLKSTSDAGEESLKLTEILETIHSLSCVDKIACERIQAVVRGLKTFSRVDESELRKADLHEGIRNTLKLSESQFRRRITMETHFGDIPEVECYPNLLNQVFLNVIINAGQAIEGEGRITIKTRLEGDSVHISISDTGRGIRPEDKDQVFSPGFTTKAVGVGSGLGLSISKRIVEEVHGGTISFESEPGAETTFHIRLPVRRKGKQG
jgi:two-component system NtrC family sensor kinase